MKRYLYLSSVIAVSLFNGCAKELSGKQDKTTEMATPQIVINSVMFPDFSESNWTPVVGGNVRLELDQVNNKDSVLSVIKDSTSCTNFALYQKIIPKGTYNISYSAGTTAAADTFMRFNGQLNGLVVDKKQTLNFTANVVDGLITIDKSFIAEGTTPTFKPDGGNKNYKLGLINGFYYLYVKDAVNGNINFIAKATGQTVSKKLNITALKQLNLAVLNNDGSIQITFGPFSSNSLSVNSNTLAIINTDPALLTNNAATWFVAADENGNLISETKYVPGTAIFKINTALPFEKNRFNLFEIEAKADGTEPQITGFLQIKKGITLKVGWHPLRYHYNTTLNIHLKNVSTFNSLLVSTNTEGRSKDSPNDTTQMQLSYQDTTRVWAQVLKNNKYTYNIFNVPKGSTDFTVDLNQLTKTSSVKSFSAPGKNLEVDLYAKINPKWGNSYSFGSQYATSGKLDYHYPAEPFSYFETHIRYEIGDYLYSYYTYGPDIPDDIKTINANFTISGSTLADFILNVSGNFDFYHASFVYSGNGPHVYIDLFSPSAGNYKNVKLPQLAKYLGMQSLDLSTQKLFAFNLIKDYLFDENKFNYQGEIQDFSQPYYSIGISKYYGPK